MIQWMENNKTDLALWTEAHIFQPLSVEVISNNNSDLALSACTVKSVSCADPENFLRGGPPSDQGWSNKFYHCKNPYLGKSRVGGTGPPIPPSGSAHECNCDTIIVSLGENFFIFWFSGEPTLFFLKIQIKIKFPLQNFIFIFPSYCIILSKIK